MGSKQEQQATTTEAGKASSMNMKLEVLTLPVADVDRALHFYQNLGWRLDADYEAGPTYRIAQFTPPGSECSVQFGRGVTAAVPGSAQSNYLVVFDIERTRAELTSKGVEVSNVFHNVYDSGAQERADGADTDLLSYHSFATFSDPDGNGWTLQQVQERQAGR